MQRYVPSGQCLLDFTNRAEGHAFSGLIIAFDAEIIETQHNVLRRNDDRFAVGRTQDVVGRHHQHTRLKLGF